MIDHVSTLAKARAARPTGILSQDRARTSLGSMTTAVVIADAIAKNRVNSRTILDLPCHSAGAEC
jgi:hypothetical protein